MITIPESFAEATIQREGEDGRKWIAELPELVAAFCEAWSLRVDGQPMHGYFGLVVPVVQVNVPYALKISWVNEFTKYEAAALAVWGGNGVVKLFQRQAEGGAMLLERLDYRRSLEDVAITEAVTIAAKLLRRSAAPDPGQFPTLVDMVAEIGGSLHERWVGLGRPFSRRLLEMAYDLVGQLGPLAGGLLVNYDIHYADVLAGEREPWLAVDPKPIVGDPEYGVAQLLWRRLEDMTAGGLDYYFDLLVETAELDPDLACGWTLARCVDYWLWGLSIGLTEDPARCEFIANWLLESRLVK